jgi:multidrug resistance efflux pump
MMSKRRWLRWLFLGLTAIAITEAARRSTAWLYANSAATPAPTAPAESDVTVCIGHVDLRNGVTPLGPAVPGRVTHVEACEGKKVGTGTVLLRLDDTLAQARLREAEADLSAARDQLGQAQLLVDQHGLKVLQQAAAVKAVRWRLTAAKRIAERKQEIAKTGNGSSAEAQAAEAAVHEVEAALEAEENKLKEVKLMDPKLAQHRAEADVQAREARLTQARKGVEECTIKAPEDGTVLRVQARPGMLLSPQHPQPPILFVADENRVIRAEVEQEFGHQVAVGQEALIHDDSSASTIWKGRVVSLSDWYSHRRSMVQEPFQFNDVRTVECLIAIDPNQPPLRIGQRVRVTLVGKKN